MGLIGQRSCIFCGELADSGEHLLPEWLQTILPSDEPVVHYREVGGVKSQPWEKRPFTEKTKVVCDGCNTGWMSRLEKATKPILTSAIRRDGPCEFDLRAQWIASQWATKTCYVFQAQTPELLAPPIHPVLLKMNGKPPPQVSVWMGSHARAVDDPINSVYIQKPLSLAPDDDLLVEPADFGYMGFLAVGGISFLVVGHRFGNYVEYALGEQGKHPAGEMFTKIWPWCRKVVGWPPPLMMDREFIDLIFDPVTLPIGFDARFFAGRVHEPPFSEVF